MIDPLFPVVREGSSNDFTVALTEMPSGDVTVTVAPADSTKATVVSGGSLTFTTGNWDDPKTVTIQALDDPDGADHLVNISLSAAGGGFGSVTDTVSLTVRDKLTGEFQQVPASHDGSTDFTFRLKFSRDIRNSYRVLRDQAFTVTNGSVTKASRVDGRSDLWNITVSPSSTADITISLGPSGTDCSAANAICTSDDKHLTSSLSETITYQAP